MIYYAGKPIQRVVYYFNISGSELVLPVSSNNKCATFTHVTQARLYNNYLHLFSNIRVERKTNVANQRAATNSHSLYIKITRVIYTPAIFFWL